MSQESSLTTSKQLLRAIDEKERVRQRQAMKVSRVPEVSPYYVQEGGKTMVEGNEDGEGGEGEEAGDSDEVGREGDQNHTDAVGAVPVDAADNNKIALSSSSSPSSPTRRHQHQRRPQPPDPSGLPSESHAEVLSTYDEDDDEEDDDETEEDVVVGSFLF